MIIHLNNIQYTNAKVVLVGDSGVGKSGLRLVLTNEGFRPTDSTHGRVVQLFESYDTYIETKQIEIRETYLWDLAGQPGYRLIHQLSLNEAAVAIIVFDSRSEIDPFAGIYHWDRALRQAILSSNQPIHTFKKFLVAARSDRGDKTISKIEIEKLIENLKFDGYVETSAKEGTNIGLLADLIRDSINWDELPKISSTLFFKRIQKYLLEKKMEGRILSTKEDLFYEFQSNNKDFINERELAKKFETGINLLESRGLIRKLNFGNLILLQPELLDSYASAIIFSAKDEPHGLGSVLEEDVLSSNFFMPANEGIENREQEKLLLIATIGDLLNHEIALRENSDDGTVLIFPSQFTREWPDAPTLEGKSIAFKFQGPVVNIYSTLVVRLSRSGFFRKEEMWKNAARFTTGSGGSCGVWLSKMEEGEAEIVLFFSQDASEEIRFQFEEYVWTHLKRRALNGTIQRRRIYICFECGTPFSEMQVERRKARGLDWITCNVCEHEPRISLADREERLTKMSPSLIVKMDEYVKNQRNLERATSILKGKIETGDFDVFLAHNSEDKQQVEIIAKKLKERAIYPWLDKEQIPPGKWFQDVIQQAIPNVKSSAVFGKSGLGRWQALELRAFISQCVEKGIPVIPVLLPDVGSIPKDLIFLRELNWVDFSNLHDQNALDNLEWGITGKKPNRDI